MAYIIKNNDGVVILTVPDNQLDVVSTSLDLIGKNVNSYGEALNNNFVKLLTSFASTDDNSPRSPQIGQLWFNKTANKLTVYDGSDFVSAYGTRVAGTKPITTSTGDLWYDTVNSQLYIWDGNSFNLVAPDVSAIYGKFGLTPPTTSTIKTADTNIPQNVGVLYSYGAPTAFVTTAAFTMSTSSSIQFLGETSATDVISGLTLFQDLEVKGDVYIRGDVLTPVKTLTTYYDITTWGDPEDPLGTTSTRQSTVNAANNYLRLQVLNKLFPVETISTLSQIAYALGSELRVLCNYNTATSVRRFILQELIPNNPYWEPYDLYYNTWTGVNNNIVI